MTSQPLSSSATQRTQLVLKDLVTLGIFLAIYFVGMFAVGTPLGFLVVTYLAYPIAYAFVSGIICMFYMAKVPKKWAVALFYFLPGLIMTVMGHTIVVLIHSAIVGLIAEMVHRNIGLKSVRGNCITHAIGSCFLVGPFWQIYILSEQYRELTASMMGNAYADQLLSLPLWIMPLLYISALIGGWLGGRFGAKILRKHFERAGLVA